MAKWVKDPALPLLWKRFDPWPGNLCMMLAQPKKKKKPKNSECVVSSVTEAQLEVPRYPAPVPFGSRICFCGTWFVSCGALGSADSAPPVGRFCRGSSRLFF